MKKFWWFCFAVAVSLCSVYGGDAVAQTSDGKSGAPNSGFLTDYARLLKVQSGRSSLMAYRDRNAGSIAGQKVFLMPIIKFPVDLAFPAIDEAVVSQSLTYVDKALREKLGNKVDLGLTPEDVTYTLQVAVTSISTEEEGKTLLDLAPIRLLTNPLKNAVAGKSLESMARVELRLTNKKENISVYESVHVYSGKSIGRSGDSKTKVTFESLKPALDAWVDNAMDELMPRS